MFGGRLMKKLLGPLLALPLAFGVWLVACSGGNDATEKGTGGTTSAGGSGTGAAGNGGASGAGGGSEQSGWDEAKCRQRYVECFGANWERDIPLSTPCYLEVSEVAGACQCGDSSCMSRVSSLIFPLSITCYGCIAAFMQCSPRFFPNIEFCHGASSGGDAGSPSGGAGGTSNPGGAGGGGRGSGGSTGGGGSGTSPAECGATDGSYQENTTFEKDGVTDPYQVSKWGTWGGATPTVTQTSTGPGDLDCSAGCAALTVDFAKNTAQYSGGQIVQFFGSGPDSVQNLLNETITLKVAVTVEKASGASTDVPISITLSGQDTYQSTNGVDNIWVYTLGTAAALGAASGWHTVSYKVVDARVPSWDPTRTVCGSAIRSIGITVQNGKAIDDTNGAVVTLYLQSVTISPGG
jgi:hypothetical protein